jgi:N-acetylneuraminic acid mutarotase
MPVPESKCSTMKRLFELAKLPSLQFSRGWHGFKTPRRMCGIAMWGSDKIIVVGGHDKQHTRLSSVEMYDISSRKWTELSPLSQPKWNCAAIVVNHKLYVFGGFNGSKLSECEVLDLSRPDSQFTRLANDLPQALAFSVVVSSGHMIYIIGGRINYDSKYDLNVVYAFDTRTNQWNDKLPPMKETRCLPAVAILGDTLVVAGGYINKGVSNKYHVSVETLDLVTGKWTNTIESMPSPRNAAMAFVEQGSSNLIIVGGLVDGGKPVTAYLRYDGNSWSEYGHFPAMTNHYNNNLSMVVATSRKCLYYIDQSYKAKFQSFTTNESATAVHFGPDKEELQPLEEAKQKQKAEAFFA